MNVTSPRIRAECPRKIGLVERVLSEISMLTNDQDGAPELGNHLRMLDLSGRRQVIAGVKGIVQRRISSPPQSNGVVRFIARRRLQSGAIDQASAPEPRHEDRAHQEVHAFPGLRLKPILA